MVEATVLLPCAEEEFGIVVVMTEVELLMKIVVAVLIPSGLEVVATFDEGRAEESTVEFAVIPIELSWVLALLENMEITLVALELPEKAELGTMLEEFDVASTALEVRMVTRVALELSTLLDE